MRFNPITFRIVCPWVACVLLFSVLHQSAWGQFHFEPTWQIPSYTEIRENVLDWIDTKGADEQALSEAIMLWPSTELRSVEGGLLLDRVVETFALLDSRVEKLVDECNQAFTGKLPATYWLVSSGDSKFVRDNLSLYYGRWLAQHEFYDEAIEMLDGLSASDVVDPAGLYFYRMVSHHHLVQPERSRAQLAQLLEQNDALPERYRKLAELVAIDLTGLEDESLDHVARRMNDVRRRLGLGFAGDQVQVIEQGVVDSLDKIIKKLEEQQQQSASSGGSAQGLKPMEDSQLPSMKAPGKVDPKDIGNQSGWGDLPPKEREEALQQIGREFPAHYRELIEQYFRDLANEPDQSSR
jgi:hypothetical protein